MSEMCSYLLCPASSAHSNLAAAQPGHGSVERRLFIVELKTYFRNYCIFSGLDAHHHFLYMQLCKVAWSLKGFLFQNYLFTFELMANLI